MESNECTACNNTPTPDRLPGSWLILLAGIGDIIVAAVFIILGLIDIDAHGMEFANIIWVFFGAIIAGTAVGNIMKRNNAAKVNEMRTGMITGAVILGIATIYFIASGTLSMFFILIIIPDIIGFIGAQKNFNYMKNQK